MPFAQQLEPRIVVGQSDMVVCESFGDGGCDPFTDKAVKISDVKLQVPLAAKFWLKLGLRLLKLQDVKCRLFCTFP